jgi:hypothetical protein
MALQENPSANSHENDASIPEEPADEGQGVGDERAEGLVSVSSHSLLYLAGRTHTFLRSPRVKVKVA